MTDHERHIDPREASHERGPHIVSAQEWCCSGADLMLYTDNAAEAERYRQEGWKVEPYEPPAPWQGLHNLIITTRNPGSYILIDERDGARWRGSARGGWVRDAAPDDYTHKLMVRRLYQLMSDISEECYCAGWMCGNEYTLWAMVSDPTGLRNYGMYHVTDEQVAELKTLSDRLGGWIVWWDDEYEPSLPAAEWGQRFLPMAEWLKYVERDPMKIVASARKGNAA